jgi:hypothetical protein
MLTVTSFSKVNGTEIKMLATFQKLTAVKCNGFDRLLFRFLFNAYTPSYR